MCFRILMFVAMLLLPAVGGFCDQMEQVYVTRWNVEPIARLSLDRQLPINAARCRIDKGPLANTWIDGRTVGIVVGRTTWRIPLESLSPGSYSVTYDLRTPTGVEWIPGVLRVPQIARNIGSVGHKSGLPGKWPLDRYEAIPGDRGPVEFAWDMENLYVRLQEAAPVRIAIDALPATPGKYIKELKIDGSVSVPWSDLFPAAPLTGQTLRYRVDGSPEWIDLLFVGTGEKQFFGATTVSNGPGGDDQGPPAPLLKAQMDLSGLDLFSVSVTWEDVEAADPGEGPRHYDWSRLVRNDNLYKSGLVLVNINLQNHWAQPLKDSDPARYWKLAEAFVSEATRKCSEAGVKHFTLGYNEPEMFARTDSKDYFNTHLTHCADAVRRVAPDAVVFAGRFSSGDPRLIREFYTRGFRGNFDVLDIHPYTNDTLTGTAMGEIVASHEALAALGMGNKRIFLGEGWGPGRKLSQVKRTRWDDPVTPEEADFTRQYYQNGYRCLVTARADYSPDWVLGGKYFTLNDNVGGTYWKQSAKPVYNPNGELMGYRIGELQFSPDSKFEPFFCNGGLIDFLGKPKGQWFYDFPPALPEVRVMTAGRPDYVLVGEQHRLDVTVVNANPRPITDLKLGIRDRSGKFSGEISAESIGPHTLQSLGPGETWRGAVTVRVDKGEPRRIRWAVEVEYKYDGEDHISDDIVPTEIRNPVEVVPSAGRVILDDSTERKISVKVRNNQSARAVAAPAAYRGSDFSASPSTRQIELASGAEAEYTLSIKPARPHPGVRKFALVDGDKTSVAVITPLDCPRIIAAPVIDGSLSDWPRDQVARGGVSFGAVAQQAERPAEDPFPKPPPAKKSAIGSKPEAAAPSDGKPAYAFGANAAVGWDDEHFYLAVVVEDATHQQRFTGMDVWKEDSIQIAFDPLNNGDGSACLPGHEMKAGYDPDDYEMSLALTGAGPDASIITSPGGLQNGPAAGTGLAVRHERGFTTYEARITWSSLHGITPRQGTRFGLDILVNNFENGRRYTLGWAGGIGGGKYPGIFVPVILR
jgi:hypothetical protein